VQEIRLAKYAIIAAFSAPGTGIGNLAQTEPLQILAKAKAYAQEAQAAITATKEVQAAVAEVNSSVSYIEGLPAAAVQQINSEVNLPGQTGGLYNSILSSAKSTVNQLENSIKL